MAQSLMARWVDITVPWDQQAKAVEALIAAYGEIPGLTMNFDAPGATQILCVQDVASAAELTNALGAMGITVLRTSTRIDEQLRLGPDPGVA